MKKFKFENGQSLVEFAISLVIILWLLAGAVEFGIALFQYIQLRDAAQEGALYGSINPPASAAANDANRLAIESRVKAASNSPIDLATDPGVVITVTATSSTGYACVADALTVRVEYTHKIFLPMAKQFTGGTGTINLGAEVTDTILQSKNTGC